MHQLYLKLEPFHKLLISIDAVQILRRRLFYESELLLQHALSFKPDLVHSFVYLLVNVSLELLELGPDQLKFLKDGKGILVSFLDHGLDTVLHIIKPDQVSVLLSLCVDVSVI